MARRYDHFTDFDTHEERTDLIERWRKMGAQEKAITVGRVLRNHWMMSMGEDKKRDPDELVRWITENCVADAIQEGLDLFTDAQ